MRAVRKRILRAEWQRQTRKRGSWSTLTKSVFRALKRAYNRPVTAQPRPFGKSQPTIDVRDKQAWAHGKMKRSGVYATRKRT